MAKELMSPDSGSLTVVLFSSLLATRFIINQNCTWNATCRWVTSSYLFVRFWVFWFWYCCCCFPLGPVGSWPPTFETFDDGPHAGKTFSLPDIHHELSSSIFFESFFLFLFYLFIRIVMCLKKNNNRAGKKKNESSTIPSSHSFWLLTWHWIRPAGATVINIDW